MTVSAPPISEANLLELMSGHYPPELPALDSLSTAKASLRSAIENCYSYRRVLFQRIEGYFGEDLLMEVVLLLGWPADVWNDLDRWGSKLNSIATDEDAPQWVKDLRG